MKETIKLGEKHVQYKLVKNKRSRRLRLSVDKNCQLVASAPRLLPNYLIERFIREKASWILKQINHYENNCQKLEVPEYKACKEKARIFIEDRVAFFNENYKFEYKGIRIKNNRRNWGSCSCKKNLNFNYRILYLPPALSDYVIVHELCHLKELNHSARFWKLVEEKITDYREIRKSLKRVIY